MTPTVGTTKKVSGSKNTSKQPEDHFCAILAINVAAFCSCLENLPNTKIEVFWINSTGQWKSEDSLALTVSCGYQ